MVQHFGLNVRKTFRVQASHPQVPSDLSDTSPMSVRCHPKPKHDEIRAHPKLNTLERTLNPKPLNPKPLNPETPKP